MSYTINQIHWNVNPEIFRIGSFALRYYSIMFMLAFASSYLVLSKIFIQENINGKLLNRLSVYIFLGTIAGARLGHCLFYEFDYYKSHLLEIILPFRFSNGHFELTGYQGLASHGGAIAVWLFSRRYKIKIIWLLDRLAIIIPLAAFFIRTGNFFNSEIIGKPADVPWAVVFERVDNLPRHPAMLYEALCYLIIFFVLLMFYKKKIYQLKPGFLFGIFLVLLFSVRFFTEFFKENQETFENNLPFNMGQLLSIPFIIAGLWLVFGKHKPVENGFATKKRN
jgi:phosphatidylglycerol:prolipoprotein diacylglycerol transferase